ncbi:MAG: three-Cys-motif partner protein TcmP [Chloroflexota bacterium]
MRKIAECLWNIKPHTLAKHEILKRYLEAWFPILATYNQRIVYFDGFCGPGRYEGGEDGSPIIAIKQALNHIGRLQAREVIFIFVDEQEDRIEHLKKEIALMTLPSNFTVYIQVAQFEETIREILDNLEAKNLNLAPTFAFIDPFGFKGIPYSLVQRLLANRKTEVFINIMAEFINRFVEHPDAATRQHIADLFGSDEALEIIAKSGNRLEVLNQLYQTQLQACAKYVRYFEMRDSRNQLIYCLFFATNHPLGYVKMKEAFWRVDPESGFHFSDATNPAQMVLFSLDPSQTLAEMIRARFSGKRVFVSVVREFVEEETIYIAKHMRSSLMSMECADKIKVEEFTAGGKKRRRGTFSDEVIVNIS